MSETENQPVGIFKTMGFYLRKRAKLAGMRRLRDKCWQIVNDLTWLGQENGRSQKDINAAKDALYGAIIEIEREMSEQNGKADPSDS